MIYTAQYRYIGNDRLDISVKGGDPIGKMFAPTWNMVQQYKKGALSESEYTRLYYDLLIWRWNECTPGFREAVERVVSSPCITLVCFCAPRTFCHRYLLVKWLKHNWPQVEYGGDREVFESDITSFSGEYRFLSNFYTSPFRCTYSIFQLSDIVFPTVEHYYQASKTMDWKEQGNILNAPTPGKAKRLGSKATLRPDWDTVKAEVMFQGVSAKFNQNPDLSTMLLATGNRKLVEGNTWGDTYWGVCNGVGTNVLGKILMTVRQNLRR